MTVLNVESSVWWSMKAASYLAIPHHKSKQKPFVVCCAQGIVPRLVDDEFQIIVKLSGCQIGATRGEGFGKLHI